MSGLPRFHRWLLLGVALAAFALYLPALGYDFVYDSVVQVGMDDFIHQPRHLLDCFSLRVLGMDVIDFNRPLNLVSLIFDAQLWGKNPAGFRLTHLFLHAAVAGLLFRWLKTITGSAGASALAALIFALHPLHTETVVEIGYREDLLVAFFLLAGLNAAAAFQPGRPGRVWGPGGLTFACLLFAAASKENGIAGPVTLAAYWWFLRREPGSRKGPWLALIGATTVAVGAFYVLRFTLEPKNSIIFINPAPPMTHSGIDWLLTQSRIWTAELFRVVWPAGLCADYGPYNLRDIDSVWALSLVFTLVVAGGVWAFLDRRAALGCILVAASMAPVSNLMPIYCPMADRYLYLPMTGLALLLGLALAKPGPWRPAAWVGTGLVAVLLAAVTLHGEPRWRDAKTLWGDVARVNPYSINSWVGRGDVAFEYGRYAESIAFYRKANEIAQGGSAMACGGIASALERLGEYQKASEALRLATKLDSRFARPDTLARALVYPDYEARRLSLVNRRVQTP
jgi:protein O-mannosyl-transferase